MIEIQLKCDMCPKEESLKPFVSFLNNAQIEMGLNVKWFMVNKTDKSKALLCKQCHKKWLDIDDEIVDVASEYLSSDQKEILEFKDPSRKKDKKK